MKKIYLFFLLLLSSTFLLAQDDEADVDLVFENQVYVDYIKSVNLHAPGVVVSYPMINLASGSLTLSFDDMAGETRDYIYSVVHCNADWTPSDLTELEYIDGFNEERIQYSEYSFNTVTNYTHYRMTLPNEDMRFTKSGNYLLKIYDNEDDKFLILTRRFMVVEPQFIVRAEVQPTAMVAKARTHQELDFSVIHKGARVSNPRQEISVVVMQNGRWDNAMYDLQPQFIKGQELIYDLLDKVVYPGGKEFRYFDLRTLKYQTDRVRGIERFKDGYDVTLFMDKMRGYSVYYNLKDLNGGFVIGNIDRNNSVAISFTDDENRSLSCCKNGSSTSTTN